MALTVGSCATETHEPRQIRKEAAISETFRVPRGSLARVNCLGNARNRISMLGARLHIKRLVHMNKSFFISVYCHPKLVKGTKGTVPFGYFLLNFSSPFSESIERISLSFKSPLISMLPDRKSVV